MTQELFVPIRLLIIQGRVPHYRIPVFNMLNSNANLEVVVLHSGRPTASLGALYREIIAGKACWGGLCYQKRLFDIVGSFDIVIAMFDVRWLSSVVMAIGDMPEHLIWWGHGFGQSDLANTLRMVLYRRADAVLLYGYRAKEAFMQRGCRLQKLFVAPNTLYVSNADFDPCTRRNHFLFVGRLQPRKRIDELIRAFRLAQSGMPEATSLSIIGSGPMSDQLQGLARSLGLTDRVHFLGRVTSDVILKPLFQRSLAYVSPGHVGLGVLHSFAYGVPVVTRKDARHAPEFENLVDGRNAMLYDGSIESLASLMVELAGSPDLSKELGKEAYAHYTESRTVDHMINGFEGAIDYVLDASV
jgi:glycosyltransferase involved in cell wall biosynthesis